jgi:hypothetical protein
MSHKFVFGFRAEDNFLGQAKKRIGHRFDPFSPFKEHKTKKPGGVPGFLIILCAVISAAYQC